MAKVSKKFVAVDLFCGGGGTSTGLLMACETLGIDPASVDLTAVNHWPLAIETHSANHPGARHVCDRLEALQPERIVPGGRADLLWASPECIHHSVARGGRPCNDQSRSQAWTVLDWVQRLQPKAILIENVPEFAGWGPLYVDGAKKGRPIPQKRGDIFRAWCSALESHNYRLNWRVLTCADYGDATTRRRFFLVAKRGNQRIRFPKPTHAQEGGARPWVPARDIIDWSIPGHSIFLSRSDIRSVGLNVQRPLAENTRRRIEAGIKKFWGEWAEPFLILMRGTGERQVSGSCIKLDSPLPALTAGGGHVGLVQPILATLNNWPSQIAGRDLDGPLPAQTTANHFGLIAPFMVRFNGERKGETPRTHGVGSPVPVIDTSGRYGICQPFILGQHTCSAPRSVGDLPPMTITTDGGIQLCQPFIMSGGHTSGNGDYIRSIDSPLSTLVTKAEQCLVRPFVVKYYATGIAADLAMPLDTVTTDDRYGLVRPVLVDAGGERYLMDILFRMLQPHELAAAHSFPADYTWCGNKSEIVKQIGNSVPVRTARALCASQISAA